MRRPGHVFRGGPRARGRDEEACAVLYQVYIPAISEDGFNISLKMEAPNWISALRSGLSKLGEQGDVVKNVMVEIDNEGVIHISNPRTGRVFEIKELQPEAPAASAPEPAPSLGGVTEPNLAPPTVQDQVALPPQEAAPTQVLPQVEPAPTVAAKQPVRRVSEPEPEGDLDLAIDDDDLPFDLAIEQPEAAAKPVPTPAPEPEPRTATPPETRRPTGFFEQVKGPVSLDPESHILEEQTSAAEADSFLKRRAFVTEEVLADVFMDAQRIYEFDADLQAATEFAMDLLMQKIPAEAGSVLFADINENDLYFATARGPKANEVMNFRVPMGKGLVGFCAKQGVSLAIADAQRDDRHYRRIGESIGFDTSSVVCAPVEADGRCYGAVELMNSRNTSGFTPGEMSVVTYVANRLADHINQVVMREA